MGGFEPDKSDLELDMTSSGRQERWEDSPTDWPQPWKEDDNQYRTDGRPIVQWPR
jgi:hypothetical protein